ncbi:MAG: protein kinase [Anaerolineales bacterium]|nr:protein kinase [Anaerolineales bacterium]
MDNTVGQTGQTIGRYRIVEHLGRGGMAEVYKAYQANLDRYVAIKLMHQFLAADQDFISRFEREAKNVAALRHPNIVQVFDFDVHNGTPYMVMEYIEGDTLKTHLEQLSREGKPLPMAEAIHIIREVGQALSYAHKQKMIHRDVKPANVMLDKSGRVILTDFGIAKILTGPSFTVTGATIGTPAYMSPEQGLGRPGDHRSDIYALGVMLYQLVTGQLPYEADTPLAVMLKHVNEPLPLPRTFKPDLPEGIERIILKAMAKNPDDRFNTADEMLAQLDNMNTAEMLAIPPASMAAGPAAHAATVAVATGAVRPVPADATRVAAAGALAAAGVAGAAGATQLRPGASGGAVAAGGGGAGSTVGGATVAGGPLPEAIGPAPAKGRSLAPVLAVILALLLLVVIGGVGFALTGGFGMLTRAATETVAPTRTDTPTSPPPSNTAPAPTATVNDSTATPDAVSTQLAAIELTQQALQQAVATATPTNTPDLTATFAACTWDYALSAQTPADGATLTVPAGVQKKITLQNTGLCAFPNGTLLVETNLPAGAPPMTVTVPNVAPNGTTELSFDWPGRKSAGTTVRTFELRQPGDLLIGQPLTLTLKYAAAATQRPAATATATQAPPTATTAAVGLTDVYPAQYVTPCQYVNGGMDYNCTVKLGWVGGSGRLTLYVDGLQVATANPGESLFYNIVSRRCLPKAYGLRLVDDGSVTQISKDFYFDPAANGSLFEGGSCTT